MEDKSHDGNQVGVPTNMSTDVSHTPGKTPDIPSALPADKQSSSKTVEIKISLPPMPDFSPITDHPAYSAARAKTERIPHSRLILSSVIIAVILFIASGLSPANQTNVTADKSPTQQLTRGTPQYKTILPADKTIQDLGGWTRVSPADRDPVFAYIDKIGTTKIIVSQQPLPKQFTSNETEHIEKLAKDYNATEKITVDGDTVYIGTSEKGPQSLILSRDNLLILIKSSLQIDSNEWAKYINSLQ